MRIFLDSGDFGTFFIDVAPGDSIQSIKVRIEVALGIPPSEQNILFAGVHLTADQTLYSCQINDGCTIRCYWYSSDGVTRLGFDDESYISGKWRRDPSQISRLGSSEWHDSGLDNPLPAPSMPEAGTVIEIQDTPPRRNKPEGKVDSEIMNCQRRHRSKSSQRNQRRKPPQEEVFQPRHVPAADKVPTTSRIQSIPRKPLANPTQGSSAHPDRASTPECNNEPDDELAAAIAASILGDFVNAPTVQLMKATQGDQMDRSKWEAVKEVLETNPKARTDLATLARLLEGREVLQE
jgi:hypothetical protein